MIVSCENCKQNMTVVSKKQDNGMGMTRSEYVCSNCPARVAVFRQGTRREDEVPAEPEERATG